MSTIQELFQQAQLAEAAYANFSVPGISEKDALIANDFSPVQASAFTTDWSVISQQSDAGSYGTTSGFSATLFKNNNTGQYSLAIRGSKQPVDFLADTTLISSDGIAVRQTIDLYNYWQSLTHSGAYGVAKLSAQSVESAFLASIYAGSPVLTTELINLYTGIDIPTGYDAARAFFVAAGYVVEGPVVYKVEAVVSTNLYTDPTDPRRLGTVVPGLSSVCVDGHSLGGHLAMTFSRLFPNATQSATAVNGLGFKIGDANVDNLFTALGNLPSSAGGVGAAFDVGKIQNIYGIAGAEFASMNNGVLQQPGGWDGIYIESSTLPIDVALGHGGPQMTDTLAIYSLLANLDPAMSDATAANLATISNIIKASSNVADRSLENTLDAVRKLFDPNATTPTGTNDREALYTNLMASGAANSNFSYTLRDLRQFTAAQIASVAEGNIAYRYALVNGNAFALVGSDVLCESHNTKHELDLYDPATGTGSLTSAYLADRASYLESLLTANTNDVTSIDSADVSNNFTYQNLSDNSSLTIKHQILGFDDTTPAQVILFGSDTNGTATETLTGSTQADHLYGMGGDDVLTGNGGADYLEGGAGNDTYLINTGDGSDTILDTDGIGIIKHNGQTLSGGENVAPNRWEDTQGNSYVLSGNPDGTQNLLIQAGGEQITVQDYSKGELGITLNGEVAPTAFTQGSGITVQGDLAPYQMPWDYWLWVNYSATWPYLFDSNGNIVRTGTPQPFFADKIFDTAGDDKLYAGDGLNVIYAYNGGNDHIVTGANDDYIVGGAGRDRVYAGGMTATVDTGAGDDIVYGEAGRDVISAGAGMDFVVGGAGADAISGGDGNDQIYADNTVTWDNALIDSGVSVSGAGEILSGDAGDDVVVGAATDDALLGGEGKDTLAGREGNDILMGDSGLVFVAPPLSEFDAIIGAARWPMGPYLNYHSPFTSAPMLNIQFDKIDNGVGSVTRYEVKLSSLNNPEAPRDNWITPATIGDNDQLYGGSGDDWLFGEWGDDLLDGGAGDDVLIGGDQADILIGGKDSDILMGGSGSDTYLFNAGDGIDYIYDSIANGDTNTLQFGVGVDPANIKLFMGSLALDLGGGDVIHIEGVDYNDIADTSSIQRFQFADGSVLSAQALVLRGFDLSGTDGNDIISGTNVTDRIVAGAGDDTLTGGAGNDVLAGGAGNDTYLFNSGDGADIIEDSAAAGAEINTLKLGAGISADMMAVIVDGNGQVTLDLGNGDSIRISQTGSLSVQNIQFSDGSIIATETLLNAPPVANPDDITVDEDTAQTAIPVSTLLANDTDPNTGDVISLAGFDAVSALGNTVAHDANGNLVLDIGQRYQSFAQGQTVTDSFGYTISDRKGETDSTLVNVTITGVNDAPVTAADDATALQEDIVVTASGNVLANDTDIDQGAVLQVANAGTYQGNFGSLVLNTDGSYSYVLDSSSLGVQSLAQGQVVSETFAYQATDGFVSTPSTLTVTITGTNDAPAVTADTATVQEDIALQTTGNVLANDSDVDQGTVLQVANAGVFVGQFGTLTLNADGSYSYALDNASYGVQSLAEGQIVTDIFAYASTDGITSTPSTLTVSITGTNDAPIVAVPLTDASTLEDQTFSYRVPDGTFTDIDQGDVLSYQAAMADGSALPDWLKFDAATQTFSGIPSNWDVGLLDVAVTATDLRGVTATSTFALDVQNVNDAPAVLAHMADQRVDNGKRFSITIPAPTFDDWDIVHGDSLSYSATLANGEELPEWLNFDAATGTFSGRAKGSDSYDILLTATDQAGASVSQVFTLNTGKHDQDEHRDDEHDQDRDDEHDEGDHESGHHDDEHDHPALDTTQDEIIVSSAVNDIIHTGNGADSILFGRGDGQDTVYGGEGTDNTLILTDGIQMNDIALTRNANDLILETGAADQITLRNWYDTTANYKSVLTLDIISQAVTEFDEKSKRKSEHKSDHQEIKTTLDQYDFSAVVAAFDQAWAADSTIQHWNAAQTLAAAHVDDGEDASLGSPAFKDMSISSLMALGQANQNLNAVQLNQNRS